MESPYPSYGGTPPPKPPESPPSRGRLRRWAVPLVAAVLGGIVALGGAAATGNLGEGDTTVVQQDRSPLLVDRSAPTPEDRAVDAEIAGGGAGLSTQEVVGRSSPGTVVVTVGGEIDNLRGTVVGQQGLGTGFVVDSTGHILTNQHVIEGFDTAAVSFQDGSLLRARVLGEDPSTDVAVLKVDRLPEGVRPLPLGDSAGLVVGDPVVALGNPLGQQYTATTGIVSALERVIDAPDQLTVIQNAIQTDAAINPGNSGGPLLDHAARVIGINSQIATRSGGNEGIGFAVPINTVKPIAESIIRTGTPEHAWIGMRGQPLTPALAEQLGLPGQRGVAIVTLDEGTPGERAGLRASAGGVDAAVPEGADIVVAVDGEPIEDMADVSRAVSSRRVGDEITLTVLRDGQRQDITFALGDRPDNVGLERP
jgi:S1-C subfamily serine protease